jgi:hypothetical protein
VPPVVLSPVVRACGTSVPTITVEPGSQTACVGQGLCGSCSELQPTSPRTSDELTARAREQTVCAPPGLVVAPRRRRRLSEPRRLSGRPQFAHNPEQLFLPTPIQLHEFRALNSALCCDAEQAAAPHRADGDGKSPLPVCQKSPLPVCPATGSRRFPSAEIHRKTAQNDTWFAPRFLTSGRASCAFASLCSPSSPSSRKLRTTTGVPTFSGSIVPQVPNPAHSLHTIPTRAGPSAAFPVHGSTRD